MGYHQTYFLMLHFTFYNVHFSFYMENCIIGFSIIISFCTPSRISKIHYPFSALFAPWGNHIAKHTTTHFP